jgi:Nif-specific regulatory protein
MACLTIKNTELGVQQLYHLHGQQVTTIGRAPTNKIVVDDDVCSRNHCEIFHDGQHWTLRDLNSRNGTFIGERRIQGDYPLEDGEIFEIGMCEFRFHLLEESSAPAPALNDPDTETYDGFVDDHLATGRPRILHRRRENLYRNISEPEIATRQNLSRDLGKLYRLALQMGMTSQVSQLTQIVLDHLLESTSADIGAILMPDPQAPQMTFETVNYRSVNAQPYQMVSSSLTRMVSETCEAVIAEDISDNQILHVRDSLGQIHATSVICAPVHKNKRVQALIHLYSTNLDNQLDTDDLDYTLAVAEQLSVALDQLLEREMLQIGLNQVQNQNRSLKKQLEIETELVGESPAILRVTRNIARIAPTDATVLIRGESGVGKELVARAIHVNSPRTDQAYVCMNCAALNESLLESELFGHEKGSFTGATNRKFGKFEQAHKGTLFLDEIGEMSLSIQAKFLRVLEGHPFERIGGSESIQADVRVVAATNRDLEETVRDGKFRKDLYFRLNVIEIIVPSVRERPTDIMLLAEHFIERNATKTGRPRKSFSPGAQEKLLEYPWPGNVRELRNVIERAYLMSDDLVIEDDDIRLSTLQVDHEGMADGIDLIQNYRPLPLEELEISHILSTLEHTSWNKSQAAQLLGIERSTLDRKLKRHGVNRPD